MKKETIFIHIPKTGGTTINAAMKGTYWANEPGFNYRHILLKEKRSNSADIFLPSNKQKYQEHTLFMMVRDPVDRLISEYHFLRERKNFMDLLKKQPKTFEEYIHNKQTQNYMVGFLVGRRIFDLNPVKENDLDNVLDAIEDIPIHVGIFEHFNESLAFFSDNSDVKWGKKIEVKRMTLNRPKKEDISNELRELILEKNQLDQELYEFCLDLFQEKSKGISKANITFIKDKYNHILPYSAGTCLFEFCMENKKYLSTNKLYFKELTFFLHQQLKVTNGKRFVEIWNNTFINTIKQMNQFDASLIASLENISEETNDPLDQTIAIANIIDSAMGNKINSQSICNKPLRFDKQLIIEMDKKNSFWGRLFGN